MALGSKTLNSRTGKVALLGTLLAGSCVGVGGGAAGKAAYDAFGPQTPAVVENMEDLPSIQSKYGHRIDYRDPSDPVAAAAVLDYQTEMGVKLGELMSVEMGSTVACDVAVDMTTLRPTNPNCY